MQLKQLQMVAKYELEKEQKLAGEYQYVQQHLQLQHQKLEGLQQHRLSYLTEIQKRATQGMGSMSYGQHQSFIDKLDKACEIQHQEINKIGEVAEQRKGLWLAQQQKRKAVDMLIDKQLSARNARLEREEQQMMDETALQKFVRKRQSI